MKKDKLILEKQFLTLEQAKELQGLGIDFNAANAWFCKCTRNWQGNEVSQPEWKLVHSMRAVVQGFEMFEYIPTFSVAEMLEMLPNKIKYASKSKFIFAPNYNYELPYDKRPPLEYCLEINKDDGKWEICYILYGPDGAEEIIPHSTEVEEYGGYSGEDKTGKSAVLLRNSLFEMLKWLKQNKSI